MQPDIRDAAFLWDMREAIQEAQSFAGGLTREALERSRLRQFALAKALEVVGEAASRVSAPFREAHPEVPWHSIIGMRHRLVHDYRRINLDIVWDVVQNQTPQLLAVLEPLIPPPPEGEEERG